MKSLWMPFGILLVVLTAGAVLVVLPGKSQAPVTPADPHADLIVVNSPAPNARVSSPLTVTGRARGSWYFEASFPVILVDWDGRIIAQAPAQAQSDWMTTDFVPFSVTLTFDTPVAGDPAVNRGTLIFKKDNPSGDPARDDAVEVPVVFR